MVTQSTTVRRIRLRLNAVAFSRHSALASSAVNGSARNSVKELQARSLGLIAASLLVGSSLIGVAVNMMVAADLGLAPYDVFSSGVSSLTDLSLGQAGWLVAAVLFAAASLLGQRPTAWSVAYILANGVAIDLTSGLINAPTSYGGRLVMVTTAIVVMAFGINFVLHAGVTGGPFELLARAGAARGIDPIKIRYTLDIGLLLAGIVIGGSLGFATVIYAATMGVVFSTMRTVLEDHRAGRIARLQPANNETHASVDACV